MPTLDLIGAIELTASAGILVGTLVAVYPGRLETKARIALGFGVWFAALVALTAFGLFRPDVGIGAIGLGAAAILPVIVMATIVLRSPERRHTVASIPLAILIGVHWVRILGIDFILLYWHGRLPAPFAPTAGWGDIFIGVTALPVAWVVANRIQGWRPIALVWSFLGALDLATAIFLGGTSVADSPIQIFTGSLDASAMTTLPWIIIPGFIVPTLFSLHVAVLTRLLRADARSGGSVPAATAA